MALPKASPRVTAARVKQILALNAAGTCISAIASRFGLYRWTVTRILEQGEDHCALKNQAMTRAIKEAARKLALKPKQRAPGRGKRVSQGKIISVKEVREYLKGHHQGLKIKVAWIPAQRKFEHHQLYSARFSHSRDAQEGQSREQGADCCWLAGAAAVSGQLVSSFTEFCGCFRHRTL
jgi:hypothetical protein